MSGSVRPQRWQPTRLPCPWDPQGKNTGVGCHFLLQCIRVESESEISQLCLTLSNTMDCSLLGSSIHVIFQARYWNGLPFPSPGDLPEPGIEARSPALQADSLPSEPPGNPKEKRLVVKRGASPSPFFTLCLKCTAFWCLTE